MILVGMVLSINRVFYRQNKTDRDVQFEITSRTAQSITLWVSLRRLTTSDYLFPSPRKIGNPMSYSYYASIIRR